MRGDKVYIHHIIDAILAIEQFTKSISPEEFAQNDLIQSGVIRKIEIIGEAVKNVSGEFKERYSKIPWKHIAGMRDKLIHQYFGVDVDRVWEVVQKDLRSLKKQILIILEKEESTEI